MKSLVGGRVRDADKFAKHEHCVHRKDKFLCFEKNLINSNSEPNRFYLIIDFLEEESMDYYKELFVNVLYNFNVPIDNIMLINNTPLTKMVKSLFSKSLTLKTTDKTEIIGLVNQFIVQNIGKTIKDGRLSNCSIVIDVSARGTIRLREPDLLFNLTSGRDTETFLNCEELYKMLDFCYKTKEIKDISFILNNCYSSFKFGGLFLNWLKSKDKYLPNTNFVYSKPLLIHIYILILFLETNPGNIECLTDIKSIGYVVTNLVNLGLSNCTGFIDNFKLLCQTKYKKNFENLVYLQKKKLFGGDRYDKQVFSNSLLMVFNDINNTASYMLFHNNLDGPFQRLDILKNLEQTIGKFNETLSQFYLEVISKYLLSTERPTTDITVNSLGLHHFKYATEENDIKFILDLVKQSFTDIPNCFMTNITRDGKRYGQPDLITLDQIF